MSPIRKIIGFAPPIRSEEAVGAGNHNFLPVVQLNAVELVGLLGERAIGGSNDNPASFLVPRVNMEIAFDLVNPAGYAGHGIVDFLLGAETPVRRHQCHPAAMGRQCLQGLEAPAVLGSI